MKILDIIFGIIMLLSAIGAIAGGALQDGFAIPIVIMLAYGGARLIKRTI